MVNISFFNGWEEDEKKKLAEHAIMIEELVEKVSEIK